MNESTKKNDHTEGMKLVKERYEKAIDKDIYDFVNDVIHDREVLPITVGFLSDRQIEIIVNELPNQNFNVGSRCVLDADTVRHIINRHGKMVRQIKAWKISRI